MTAPIPAVPNEAQEPVPAASHLSAAPLSEVVPMSRAAWPQAVRLMWLAAELARQAEAVTSQGAVPAAVRSGRGLETASAVQVSRFRLVEVDCPPMESRLA